MERITLALRRARRTSANRASLRSLLAHTGGTAEFARRAEEFAGSETAVGFKVQRVVDGDFSEPWVQVVLTGEAAHAAPAGRRGFAGVWTVQRLPDGTLFADDIEDTPFPKSAVEHREVLRAKIREGLTSGDPTHQTLALASLGQHDMREFVPQIIGLLGSDAEATSRPWLVQRYGTVGKLAALRLFFMLDDLVDDTAPAKIPRDSADDATRAEWHRWWQRTAQRPPRPRPR